MNQLTLHINSPTFGLCIAGDALEVEIFAMLGQEHCDYEYILQSVGKQNVVYITIDDKFVAIARYINEKKATYVAKINLINFLEGRHTIKALFPKESYIKTNKVPESDPVDFVVDNTPPSIRSVFPSNIVKLKDTDVSSPVEETKDARPGIDVNKCSVTFDLCLIIEAEDVCSGIDVDNCTASLDGKFLGRPTIHKSGVVFLLVNEPEAVSHKLKAIIQDRAGNRAEYESDVIIDSSTLLISDVVVETEKPVSELDLQRCGISIDGQPPYPPSYEMNCLVFPLEMKLRDIGAGQHKITISIFDIAGNVTEYNSEFFVDKKESIKDERHATTVPDKEENLIPSGDVEAQSRERLLKNLREKLVIDRQFLKQWLKNLHGTAVETGLSYADEMWKYLPPAPPEEYIGFSIKSDDENVLKIIDSLMTRVSAAIKKHTPSSLKTLKKEGVYMKNGAFTNSAKETINALLQDPVGMLECAGIKLTDEERDAVFPPFPKINAEELTGWISMVQVDGF